MPRSRRSRARSRRRAPTVESIRVERSESSRLTCGLCRESIDGTDTTGAPACGACGTRVHAACAAEFGRCPTLGCEAVASRPAARRRVPPPRIGWLDLVLAFVRHTGGRLMCLFVGTALLLWAAQLLSTGNHRSPAGAVLAAVGGLLLALALGLANLGNLDPWLRHFLRRDRR